MSRHPDLKAAATGAGGVQPALLASLTPKFSRLAAGLSSTSVPMRLISELGIGLEQETRDALLAERADGASLWADLVLDETSGEVVEASMLA